MSAKQAYLYKMLSLVRRDMCILNTSHAVSTRLNTYPKTGNKPIWILIEGGLGVCAHTQTKQLNLPLQLT